MEYRLHDIAKLLNVSVAEPLPATNIETLLTDSRKLIAPQTSLFFALDGPQRNGHLYIPELYKKGVRFFVVSQPVAATLYPSAQFFKVPDTLDALQQIAAAHRKKFDIDVIGITGSNGKTVVKEWLFQLLQPVKNIVRSPKSYNSQFGVPLSVWQMNIQNDLAIFEAGISKPGEMEKLQQVIQPTIGLLTNIGTAHSEGFSNDAEKLTEKLKLFQHAKVVIANGDVNAIRNEIEKLAIPFFSWGHDQNNQVQVLEIKSIPGSTTIHIKEKGRQFRFEIPFTDEASIENAISCVALLLYLNTDTATIQAGMKNLQAVNMRLEFKRGINNCTIINDSYSADFNSLSIALDFLQQQAKTKKKTVVLSDFLENKEEDVPFYKAILNLLKKYGVNRFIGIGEKMQSIFPGLLNKNTGMETDFYFSTKEYAQHFHTTQFKDEYVLVKGARKFGFERIVGLLEQKVHQTILEINLDAVAYNLKTIQQQVEAGVKVMVMVKAFGYGSGASEIASVVQFHKADYLGVAYVDEGVELRQAGITIPIMVLNVEENAFDAMTEHYLEPDIYSFELLHAFETHLRNAGLKDYPVHIEIETGMNRSGFETVAIDTLVRQLKNNEFLKVQSVFSHLAASEDKVEDKFTLQQYELLKAAITRLQNGLRYDFIKHIANTAAIFRFPQLQLDMVRLGIGLYGISGSNDFVLQTVATLKTTISQIKKIKKGETVSYNRRGIAKEDLKIATMRIGYADGYSRRLGNGTGKVWVNGQLAPVIGTVCMDMTMIDITHIPSVKEGDEVIVFGAPIPVQQIAEWIGTIPYEIMTGISQRVKRVYFGEG